MKWLLLITIIFAVITDAAGDALREEGEKGWSHFLEVFTIIFILTMGIFFALVINDNGVFIATTLIDFSLYFAGMYIVQRLFFFDLFYNAIRGWNITYIGNTAWSDRLLRKIHMHPTWWLWTRLVLWLFYTGGVMLNY